MRLVGFAALCLGVSAPAAAQPPAATEVLLEVNAAGTVTSRADLATFRISIQVQGDSADDARRLVAERARRLTAAATSLGVAPSDIETGPVRIETLQTFDVVDAALADLSAVADTAADRAGAAGSRPAVSPPPLPNRASTVDASSALVIRLRDLSRDEALGIAIAEIQGGLSISGPVYSLSDPRPSRTEARTRALAAARAEAEDYAAALGLRVVRMVRITDRIGTDLLSMMMSESGRAAAVSLRESDGSNVVTVMPIGVDYVLAPR